jgi:hypothetical protein
MASDRDIIREIDELVEEEHALERRSSEEGIALDDDERIRLRSLEEHLDQLWDLLRQRRARRDAGLDPDDAAARDASVVEHYRQ